MQQPIKVSFMKVNGGYHHKDEFTRGLIDMSEVLIIREKTFTVNYNQIFIGCEIKLSNNEWFNVAMTVEQFEELLLN